MIERSANLKKKLGVLSFKFFDFFFPMIFHLQMKRHKTLRLGTAMLERVLLSILAHG